MGLILVTAFKSSILRDDPQVLHHVDYLWRILIGAGCIPGCLALYFRLTIPETPRFTMDIERNVQQASDDIQNVLTTGKYEVNPDVVVQRAEVPKASWADFRAHFSKWQNGKILLGTAYSWFALDVSPFVSLPWISLLTYSR
jgi:PHS family inorganic phosphate transporter-like MFS transporter